MSMSSMLNQSIIWTPQSGYDGYGRGVDAASQTLGARFEKKSRTRQLPNDQIVELVAVCWVDSDPGISINDKITYLTSDYRVHSVDAQVDGQGNTHHTTLELAKWLS